MKWAVPLAGLIIMEVVADVWAQEFALKAGPARWCAAIASYVLANAFWLEAMRRGVGLGRGAVLFSVATGIIAVLVGTAYQEQVSPQQWAGIALGIVSTYLLVH